MSFKNIYKIGMGPSSSHTMGPKKAAELFAANAPETTTRLQVELYASLAATGKGHFTDRAILTGLGKFDTKIIWYENKTLSVHPNGMIFRAFDKDENELTSWTVYSIGGGDLCDSKGKQLTQEESDVDCKSLDEILEKCLKENTPFWKYVESLESDDLWDYMGVVWQAMCESVVRGLNTDQKTLEGSLNLPRRAPAMLEKANRNVGFVRDLNLVSSYALAAAEENAAGGIIVTAPTCGSAGVLPAVLYYFHHNLAAGDQDILRALATASLFAKVVQTRASISGAEVGCQGEIGTACAMACAAVTQLQGGTVQQIEYAAEMGLEHCLGLTCDPIDGLVQVPCIERNAFAAMRAMECAAYALATDGQHLVSFDNVTDVMYKTGKDLQSKYRETAAGGLAKIRRNKLNK